jgi:hypothetical protein
VKQNRFFRILVVAIILSLLMIALPATPVLASAVDISPEKGSIGSRIDIEGAGFTPGVALYVYFSSQEAEVDDQIDDEVTIYQEVKRLVIYGTTDINPGTFESAFYVPEKLLDGDDEEDVHGGTYYVYTTYTNDDDIMTADTFTVIGISQLTPAEGPVGTRVKIEGVGFEDKEDIILEYDGADIEVDSGDRETGSDGDFLSYFLVPASIAGVHTVTAVVAGEEGEFQFEVVPSITADPTSGAPGDQVTVNGAGFGNKRDITITFDGDAMETGGDDDTDNHGSFESTFYVPSDMSQGTYEIEAEDTAHNKADAEFSISTSLTLTSGATAALPAHVGEEVTISGRGFRPNWPISVTSFSWSESFTAESQPDGSFSCIFPVPACKGGLHTIAVTDGVENTDQVSFYVETTPPSPVYALSPLADSELAEDRFDWGGDAEDPSIEATDVSLPITYELQIATNGQFTSDSILVNKIELDTSEYTLSRDEKQELADENPPYYWRVRAKDAADNPTAWTEASTFTIGFAFHMPTWLMYLLIGIGAVGVFFLGYWLGRRSTGGEEYYGY